MKTRLDSRLVRLFPALAALILNGNAFGQGAIRFANDDASAISNCLTGARLPVGTTFRVALYYAPHGQTNESAFIPIGPQTSITGAPGRFDGGIVMTPSLTPPGGLANFQVRTWESVFGDTYETAASAPAQGNRYALLGKSETLEGHTSGNGKPLPSLPDLGLRSRPVCPSSCLTLTCPADIATVGNGLPVTINYPIPTTSTCCTSNSGRVLVKYSAPSGSSFTCPSRTRVSCTATDGCGNSETCTFEVLVSCLSQSPVLLQPTGWKWKYLANGSDQGTAWRSPMFDDSAWPEGDARLGFGGDGERTVIGSASTGYITYYFRRAFVVGDNPCYSALVSRMIRDDGAVVYLNGAELFRSFMPPGPIMYTTRATVDVSGAAENTFVTNSIAPGLLVPGVNVIAVEVHQFSDTSSDLGFDFELRATPAHTGGNVPPSVSITTPATGTLFPVGTNVTVQATATAPGGGSITGVVFRLDPGPTFADATAPFSAVFGSLTAGTHTLTAVARDDCGYSRTSAPVTIVVTNDPNVTVLVPNGALWKFLDNGSDQGTAWRAPGFSDTIWNSGLAELGYGDAADNRPEMTVVSFGSDPNNKPLTTYFRHAFDVPEPSAFSNLTVRLLRDDGGVVYLNGEQIFRSNMQSTDPILFDTPAALAADDGTIFFSANVDRSRLVTGRNVLAVEIHQQSASSSDISFDLMLHAQPALPPVLALRMGGSAVIVWTGGGTLQAATRASGPWIDVPSATSPYAVPMSAARRFFRVRH